ncbi:nuclear transport factor 2 family protein [uncultured Novosphingobium sp.]|uniref:nuclear transport factor 2 family protein n=1 Tax=uncultured Novosphingobium sp. TaxID=292277 RepID=UPI002583B0E1|nr:nuclear transport factor 2 family protein [uncultured Novosphingobium sp.]
MSGRGLNAAERLLRRMFHWGDADAGGQDLFLAADDDAASYFHPDCVHHLFGPTGTKEMLVGRQAMLDFSARCAAALSARSDQILTISGIDEQCGFVHARALRESKATGERLSYEWSMQYRVEDDLITYGADMLDADAQAFWGRIDGAA